MRKPKNLIIDPKDDLKHNVPPAPYGNQTETWNAIDRILVMENRRELQDLEPVSDNDIFVWTGLPRPEIVRTSLKPQFITFCQGRAKNHIEKTMAHIAAPMASLLEKLAHDALTKDSEEAKKDLKQLTDVFEKFGIKNWDGYRAEVEEEIDVEKVVDECLKIINSLPGWAVPPPAQRFLKKVIEPSKEERDDPKVKA